MLRCWLHCNSRWIKSKSDKNVCACAMDLSSNTPLLLHSVSKLYENFYDRLIPRGICSICLLFFSFVAVVCSVSSPVAVRCSSSTLVRSLVCFAAPSLQSSQHSHTPLHSQPQPTPQRSSPLLFPSPPLPLSSQRCPTPYRPARPTADWLRPSPCSLRERWEEDSRCISTGVCRTLQHGQTANRQQTETADGDHSDGSTSQ